MRAADLLYRALNVPMRAMLQSPLHGFGSKALCILTFRGRKSGREFTTPLSFVRDGDIVRLLTSQQTQWWKNFVDEPVDVEVEIARTVYRGRAESILKDGDRLRDGVRQFLTALPRDAIVYGIKLDRDRRPCESGIERAAGHVVLVEIKLSES